MHAAQAGSRAGLLPFPQLAAVARVPDGAVVAHGPAFILVDELHGVDGGVFERDRGLGEGRRRNRGKQNGEREAEVSHADSSGTLRRRVIGEGGGKRKRNLRAQDTRPGNWRRRGGRRLLSPRRSKTTGHGPRG